MYEHRRTCRLRRRRRRVPRDSAERQAAGLPVHGDDLVSVVIFLCGVLVGRGVKPLDTVAQAAGPQASTRRRRRQALTAVRQAMPRRRAPSPAPPARRPRSRRARPPKPAEDDTQPTPLGDDPEPRRRSPSTPPRPRRRPSRRVEPQAAAEADAEAGRAEARRQAGAGDGGAASRGQAGTPAPAPAAGRSRRRLRAGPASTAPATPPAAIAVQVGAFNTRREADALAKRLAGRATRPTSMNPTA